MPYVIDLTDDGVADDLVRLQEWALDSLLEALTDAAQDPHRLDVLLDMWPSSRVLDFADGRGVCLVEIVEDDKRIALRQVIAPQ
ncbi:hypothetical protein ACIQGZ_17300 [Streptomyces sp. NPDC092296]|uniref:hypothetical protein n=1 Tax=Streptomyces sp. NPDC092296 TaxID=3366012 RepID=UPI00382BDA55